MAKTGQWSPVVDVSVDRQEGRWYITAWHAASFLTPAFKTNSLEVKLCYVRCFPTHMDFMECYTSYRVLRMLYICDHNPLASRMRRTDSIWHDLNSQSKYFNHGTEYSVNLHLGDCYFCMKLPAYREPFKVSFDPDRLRSVRPLVLNSRPCTMDPRVWKLIHSTDRFFSWGWVALRGLCAHRRRVMLCGQGSASHAWRINAMFGIFKANQDSMM